jgi:hypothetical protein
MLAGAMLAQSGGQAAAGRRTRGGAKGRGITNSVIGAALIIAGCASLVWSATTIQKAGVTSTWPRTTGAVERSELTEEWHAKGGRTYTPHVIYRYQIDGIVYRGHVIQTGSEGLSYARDIADGIVARYGTGRVVDVFYDPSDPADAVLERGFDLRSQALFIFFFGLIPLLVGAVAVVQPLVSRD